MSFTLGQYFNLPKSGSKHFNLNDYRRSLICLLLYCFFVNNKMAFCVNNKMAYCVNNKMAYCAKLSKQSDKIFNHLEEVHTTAAAALQHSQTTPPTAELSEIDYHLRQVGGNSSFATLTSLMSNNIALEREPVHSG